jgi:UDP-N-acetylmuramoyl-L-alanyl-D-glutamate--2,6-diaminopimelate ligase
MEDRYSAIRAAIGTAQAGDVVYLAGKGDEDFQEYADDVATGTGTIKGWFDDRVEARNALSRLRYLEGLPHMQRETLPWGDPFSETTAVFV